MTAMLIAALMTATVPGGQDPCANPDNYRSFLGMAPEPARQGATIAINAMRGLSHVEEEEPVACTSDWKVSHPEALTLAPDRKSFTVAADAVPETRVTIGYTVRGARVERTVVIVGADAVVLTGTRSQKNIERCDAPRIGELEFSATGGFSVTHRPFERYRDYWGTYTFDPDTGALEMTVTGGNAVPPGLDLSGTATIEDGKLILDGFNLGRAMQVPGTEDQGCRYTF